MTGGVANGYKENDMLSSFHDADGNRIDADGIITPDLPDSPDFDPNNNVFIGGDSSPKPYKSFNPLDSSLYNVWGDIVTF
jgi:hypothetical protein